MVAVPLPLIQNRYEVGMTSEGACDHPPGDASRPLAFSFPMVEDFFPN